MQMAAGDGFRVEIVPSTAGNIRPASRRQAGEIRDASERALQGAGSDRPQLHRVNRNCRRSQQLG